MSLQARAGFVRLAFMSFAPQLLVAAVSLGMLRVYTELLEPKQLGLVMLTLSSASLAQMLISAAGAQTAFYYASRYGCGAVVHQFGGQLRFATAIAVVLCCASAILATNTFQDSTATYILGFVLFLGIIIVDFYRAGLQSLINLNERRVQFGALLVIDSVATLVFSSGAFLFNPNPVGLLFALGVSKSIGLLASAYFVQDLRDSACPEDAPISLGKMFRYSIPFSLMGLLGWSTANLDRFVVAYTAGPAVAGIYALAGSIVARPYGIVTAALTVHHRPKLFQSATSNSCGFRSTFVAWAVSAVAIGALGSVLFFLFGDAIVNLLISNDYTAQVANVVVTFSVAFGLTLVAHAFENRYLARGENKRLLSIQVVYVPISVIVLFFFTMQRGFEGAVEARVISELLRVVVMAGGEWLRGRQRSTREQQGDSS